VSTGSRFLVVAQASRNPAWRGNPDFCGNFGDMQAPADTRLRVEIDGSGKLARSGRSIVAASHLNAHPFFRSATDRAAECDRWQHEVRENLLSLAGCQTLCSQHPLGTLSRLTARSPDGRLLAKTSASVSAPLMFSRMACSTEFR
jgi:hypothetical protein